MELPRKKKKKKKQDGVLLIDRENIEIINFTFFRIYFYKERKICFIHVEVEKPQ